LIDIVLPDERFTAGDFSRVGRATLAAITDRGRLPIVAGGTGFYLRALLDGLFQGPARDDRLRARLAARETRRPGWLHKLLSRFDPLSASRIHPNDINKLIRALEVLLHARRPLSEMFRQGGDPLTGYRVLKLALDPPRTELYQRLDRRVLTMFDHGLIEETRAILTRGYPASAKPFESLGYQQAVQFLQGTIRRERAIADTQVQTRRYAKRQWTWFRREQGMIWLQGFGDQKEIQTSAIGLIVKFLEADTQKPRL
jgi:tRNA dimethylallyltransferase